MHYLLEVIAFNAESCAAISKTGAARIELCASPAEGGTTPSHGMIRKARQLAQQALFPIIRPRGGDFLYNDDEFEIMADDIRFCKSAGCDGVVTGLLKKDGEVDTERMSRLVDIAYPMDVTFHRAFDRTRDLSEALETIIATGCTRILTSGGKPTAGEASNQIRELIVQADERIVLMPGSGIRSANLASIIAETGATEFHTSARKARTSEMTYGREGMTDDQSVVTVDEDEINLMINILQTLKL